MRCLIASCWLCFAALAEAGNDSVSALSRAVAVSESLPAAALIPREAFISTPAVGPAYLSPDARLVIHTEHDAGMERLVVHDTETSRSRELFTTRTLGAVAWSAGSRRIFFETDDGVADVGVQPNSAPKLLWHYGDAERDRLLTADSALSDHFLALRYVKKTRTYELIRVGPDDSVEVLFVSETPLSELLQSPSGDVLFVAVPRGDRLAILALGPSGTQEVHSCAFDEVCAPAAYAPARNTLTVIKNGQDDLSHAVQIDLIDGGRKTLHRDPAGIADMDSLRVDRLTGEPVIATYWRDYKENHGLTPEAASHVGRIEERFGPQANLTLQPGAHAGPWLVTEQVADRRALHHHLYWPESGAFEALPTLTAHHPLLVPANLAPVTPFAFTASDNRTIHAYVTLPRGRDPRTTPLIVMPHGGPWNRDVATFSMGSQFLANRGYAVYQPNFRGSTGYGRAYLNSANRDFGDGRVQDDIIEGLLFLLDNGIGDRERLAIYGHSFGGFSALTALTFTPELFRVGVAGAPPTDLGATFRRMTETGRFARRNPLAPLAMASRLGDLEDTVAMQALYQKSPLAHVGRVQRPLLILAGEQDERVSRDEVVDYALRLDALGKPLSLLMVAEEGHAYKAPAHREAYLYLLEMLMARHLGGRFQLLARENPHHEKLRRLFRSAFQIDRLGLADLPEGQHELVQRFPNHFQSRTR